MPVRTVLRRHWIISVIAIVILVPVLVFVIWSTITLHYTYASGDRAGYLQKISQRGWLWKTWEGELQLTAIPGAAPEKFIFTTRSDSIAKELNRFAGQHVSLHYEQHKGVPSSCFGDTEYFVTGVHVVSMMP